MLTDFAYELIHFVYPSIRILYSKKEYLLQKCEYLGTKWMNSFAKSVSFDDGDLDNWYNNLFYYNEIWFLLRVDSFKFSYVLYVLQHLKGKRK